MKYKILDTIVNITVKDDLVDARMEINSQSFNKKYYLGNSSLKEVINGLKNSILLNYDW